MEKEYAEDEETEDAEDDDDEAPDLITSREDFEQMMDQFLDNYEILGGKMKPKLEGDSAIEKLNTLRRAMRNDSSIQVYDAENSNDQDILVPVDVDDVKDRWDCETILCKLFPQM
jgi:protein LTV1